jgi:DNA-binding transcriptional ArsR family regulator
MDTLLSTIRSECDRQRSQMAIWEQIESLVDKLDVRQEPVERTSEPRVGSVRSTGQRRSRRQVRSNPSRDDILRFIAEHGPVGRREINRALAGDVNSLDRHLTRLVRAGMIEVEGESPRRRYRTPRADLSSTAAPSAEGAPRADTTDERVPCSGPDELLSLIGAHAPITTQRLRELTGLGYQQLIEWGRVLARRRAVTFVGEGPNRSWRPMPKQDLASEVLATISADPATYNEHRIALALRATYERVGAACAALLDRGSIELTDAGTYIPASDATALAEVA